MGLKENQLLFLSQTIQQLSPLKHLVFYFVFSQLIQCIFKTVKPDQSHCYRPFQMGTFDLSHLKKTLTFPIHYEDQTMTMIVKNERSKL